MGNHLSISITNYSSFLYYLSINNSNYFLGVALSAKRKRCVNWAGVNISLSYLINLSNKYPEFSISCFLRRIFFERSKISIPFLCISYPLSSINLENDYFMISDVINSNHHSSPILTLLLLIEYQSINL